MYQYRLRLDSARLAVRRSAASILCERKERNKYLLSGLFDWIVKLPLMCHFLPFAAILYHFVAFHRSLPAFVGIYWHLISFAFTCQQIATSQNRWNNRKTIGKLTCPSATWPERSPRLSSSRTNLNRRPRRSAICALTPTCRSDSSRRWSPQTGRSWRAPCRSRPSPGWTGSLSGRKWTAPGAPDRRPPSSVVPCRVECLLSLWWANE